MDSTTLLLGLLFGSLGTGYILYARNAGKILPAAAGAMLLVLPYVLTTTWLMSLICTAAAIVPWIWRDL